MSDGAGENWSRNIRYTAERHVAPRTVDELRDVLLACQKQKVPVRMLGGGNNLLIRDDPIPGAVVRLVHAAFTMIEWDGKLSLIHL